MKILEIAGNGTVGTRRAGPVSTVITHLANGFAERRHEVTLLDGVCSDSRSALAPGVSVHELPLTGGMASTRTLVDSVRSVLDADTFDVVHVHESNHARLLGRDCGVPVLWTAHMLNWTMGGIWLDPRALVLRWRDRAATRAVDRIVVLNRQTERALASDKVRVIANGIDLESWPTVDRAEARRALGIPSREFRVTCLGRVAPEKGTHVFARAVALARKEIPVAADVVGSLSGKFGDSDVVTPYAERLRRSADDLQFRGFIHRDESEYRLRLAAADAVIVPSITEPFGLVVLEALACGAWVIGSDVGGIRDVLSGHTGDLVPPGNATALARAIVQHHQRSPDPGRAEMARARAAQFTWKRAVDSYLELVFGLVAEVHR